MKPVDYTINSRPYSISCECPYCGLDIEVLFDNVHYYDEADWGAGGYIDCPECESQVELDDYEYD